MVASLRAMVIDCKFLIEDLTTSACKKWYNVVK